MKALLYVTGRSLTAALCLAGLLLLTVVLLFALPYWLLTDSDS
jgi:hypothetical protein